LYIVQVYVNALEEAQDEAIPRDLTLRTPSANITISEGPSIDIDGTSPDVDITDTADLKFDDPKKFVNEIVTVYALPGTSAVFVTIKGETNVALTFKAAKAVTD
jgi:hypothetical protein